MKKYVIEVSVRTGKRELHPKKFTMQQAKDTGLTLTCIAWEIITIEEARRRGYKL